MVTPCRHCLHLSLQHGESVARVQRHQCHLPPRQGPYYQLYDEQPEIKIIIKFTTIAYRCVATIFHYLLHNNGVSLLLSSSEIHPMNQYYSFSVTRRTRQLNWNRVKTCEDKCVTNRVVFVILKIPDDHIDDLNFVWHHKEVAGGQTRCVLKSEDPTCSPFSSPLCGLLGAATDVSESRTLYWCSCVLYLAISSFKNISMSFKFRPTNI